MLRRSQALLLAALALYAAPQPVSVAALISLVRNSLARHESDNKLAGELHKVWLGQRLDDHTIEELESEGAGPKSVAELLDLRDGSAGLPAPVALPDFRAPAIPSPAEQDEILKAAAVSAASYSAGLPDFICSEIVHRFEDIGGSGKWKPMTVRAQSREEAQQFYEANRVPAQPEEERSAPETNNE